MGSVTVVTVVTVEVAGVARGTPASSMTAVFGRPLAVGTAMSCVVQPGQESLFVGTDGHDGESHSATFVWRLATRSSRAAGSSQIRHMWGASWGDEFGGDENWG